MYSNVRCPEAASMDGSLFAPGGDEEERAECGVVLLFVQPERWMYFASHNQNPSYFLMRQTTA